MHELPSTCPVTLGQVWTDYKYVRCLKPNTINGYRKVINHCLGDWLDLPVEQITKEMIELRHKQLTMGTPAQANLAMRIMRALLTFAGYKYDSLNLLVIRNPVHRLSELRCWNRLPRRNRIILPHEMPLWFHAVLSLHSKPDIRDLLIVLMLTGLRRNEASQLEWRDIDLKHKTLTVRCPKNNIDHVLPLSWQLQRILEHRNESRKRGNEFVFPGRSHGHSLSKWSQQHRVVTEITGIPFMLHDLRRTFITVADQLEMPDRVIKMLANHVITDITTKYIYRSVERLRTPMQLISDEIMRQAELTEHRWYEKTDT